MTAVQKQPKMATIHRVQSLQNGHFGSKIKIPKNMQKTTLQSHQSCSVQKNGSKKYLIFEKLQLYKNGLDWQLYKGYKRPQQNDQFGSQIKIPKNKRQTTLQSHQCCSAQKTARKNTKYLTNETILKIGHFAKAIAFAKWSVWVKN